MTAGGASQRHQQPTDRIVVRKSSLLGARSRRSRSSGIASTAGSYALLSRVKLTHAQIVYGTKIKFGSCLMTWPLVIGCLGRPIEYVSTFGFCIRGLQLSKDL